MVYSCSSRRLGRGKGVHTNQRPNVHCDIVRKGRWSEYAFPIAARALTTQKTVWKDIFPKLITLRRKVTTNWIKQLPRNDKKQRKGHLEKRYERNTKTHKGRRAPLGGGKQGGQPRGRCLLRGGWAALPPGVGGAVGAPHGRGGVGRAGCP